jgi:hypothetical protein
MHGTLCEMENLNVQSYQRLAAPTKAAHWVALETKIRQYCPYDLPSVTEAVTPEIIPVQELLEWEGELA